MADDKAAIELKELNSIAQQILGYLKDKSAKGKKGATKEDIDKKAEDAQKELTGAVDATADSFVALGKEFFSIAAAGAQLASTLGQTVTQGIRQEFRNRNTIAAQIFTTDRDRIISSEQLVSAQQALTDTFVSVGEGMEISANGAAAFSQSLKGGFKSDFKLTGDSMRALITAGVATETGFENLRKASGRASLSNEQLSNLVNKNSLSFMIYGPKFAKAAVEAERLGINLAATQAAQESMVNNLDGTLDTLNQVNQLGAQIDFGTLMRLNEFEGPEATLKYLQSTIPPSLFQSASTRAMLRNLGIPLEDLMKKQGSAQDQAAKTMEDAMTKLAEPVGVLSSLVSDLFQRGKALTESYGPLIKSAVVAGGLLFTLSKTIGFTNAVMLTLRSGITGIAGLREGMRAGLGKETLKNLVMGGAKPTTPAAPAIPAVGGGAGSGLGAFLQGLAGGLKAIANPQALVGLAAVTLAIIGLGFALRIAAPGIEAFGMAVKSAFEGIGSIITAIGGAIGTVITAIGGAISNVLGTLATMSPVQLFSIGLALGTIGTGLLAFGVGGLVAVPALIAVTNRMKALSDTAGGMQLLSNSFKELTNTIRQLNELDLSKLKELNATMPRVGPIGVAVAAISANARMATTATARPAAEANELTRKIDELVRVLRDTKTVINVDNKLQQVPRTALAGVNIRNDRV